MLVETTEAAVAGTADDVDLAGPRTERLVDLAQALVDHDGLDLEVVATQAVPSMAGGSMLPGPDAVIRGVDWWTWLASRPH